MNGRNPRKLTLETGPRWALARAFLRPFLHGQQNSVVHCKALMSVIKNIIKYVHVLPYNSVIKIYLTVRVCALINSGCIYNTFAVPIS